MEELGLMAADHQIQCSGERRSRCNRGRLGVLASLPRSEAVGPSRVEICCRSEICFGAAVPVRFPRVECTGMYCSDEALSAIVAPCGPARSRYGLSPQRCIEVVGGVVGSLYPRSSMA
jgi:hypothetical protein